MCRFSVQNVVSIVVVSFLVACSLFSYTIPYEKINKETRNNKVSIAEFKVGRVHMNDLRFSHDEKNRLKVETELVLKVKRPLKRSFKTKASVTCRPEMNWPDVTCKDYRDWSVTLGPVKLGVNDLGPTVNRMLEEELRKQVKQLFASDKVPEKYRNKLDTWGPYLRLDAAKDGFRISLK